jgi:hypothetical protein
MKRAYSILVFIFLSLSIIPIHAENAEDLIIPQSNPVYEDYYQMARAGMIKSVPAEQLRISPMTEYDAAGYIVEAAASYVQAGQQAVSSGMAAKIKQYYAIYLKKAYEIYGKTVEMRKKLAFIEQQLKSPDVKALDETIDAAKVDMFDIEKDFAATTFRGVAPFAVMGQLEVRWQNVNSNGISRVNQTSLGGTFMSLWTQGLITPDVMFNLNLNFERPHDEANKLTLPEYWGTGQRFLDKYTINLKAYGWQFNSGFFWEDITPFIAKSTLSERPGLFDRDPYSSEETTKGHFENAFLHSFIKRGDIWSMHGFMGAEAINMDLPFGGRIKVMAGKAEGFDDQYDKNYLYEYAGRFVQPLDALGFSNSHVALNFFNTSNEESEIETMAPTTPGPNFPYSPEGYLQSETIAGGDAKLNFGDLSLGGEFERCDHFGYLPKPFSQYLDQIENPDYLPPKFHQDGNAFYIDGVLKNILPFTLEAKFTSIDPGYIGDASAVVDTNDRTITASSSNPVIANQTTGVSIRHDSYASDPTLIYNNLARLQLTANVTMPESFGFINLNYSMAEQLTATTDDIYVDHYDFGNRLTGPMYWHLFFSQYGYPVPGRDNGFFAYNSPANFEVFGQGTGLRYMFTSKWLTNKELIVSDYDLRGQVIPTSMIYGTLMSGGSGGVEDSPNYQGDTQKYEDNASIELKFALHKLLQSMGIQSNNLFVDLYGELVTLQPGADIMPTYDPNTLFSQNLMNAFIVYNLTKKTNIMFEAGLERWATNYSLVTYAMDTTTNKGDGPFTAYIANLPVNYFDNSFGLGFDYDFAPRTSLYLRVKRFFHRDLGGSFMGVDTSSPNYIPVVDPTNPPVEPASAYKQYNSSAQDFDGWYFSFEISNFF